MPVKYFWGEIYVDSVIEGDIVKTKTPEQVFVFGKLPRRSIRVPLYTGGTTSPDFVFAVKNNGDTVAGSLNLYLLVEAKSDDKRTSEMAALAAQKHFFASIGVQWKEITDVRDVNDKINEMLGNGSR
ncbi:MAG: hypothetical protein LBT89_07520 [Planctomycetaceae bacterium]|nr:hypothetical protein [Planctomycetaceae bacterium]